MKKIIITTSWDDGHVLDLKLATLLKRYEIKGTFYIAPRNREFKSFELLNDEQILHLSRNFEIGAHTLTHPRLSNLSFSEAAKEIKRSKQYLEHLLGKSIESFCYPGGDYTYSHMKQVESYGFKLARTVRRFSFDMGKSPFALPTSIHAYNHRSDAWQIGKLAQFNCLKFMRYYRSWNFLAKAMFDNVLESGGVFHLWGHSWEIEKNNQWEALEDVLKYISKRKDAVYATNRELI